MRREQSQKKNQTNEERYRSYLGPELETKRLEIFQKMIEGTQALLDKQLDKQRLFEDHMKSQSQRGQVSCGPGNLVSSDKVITKVLQKNKKRKIRAILLHHHLLKSWNHKLSLRLWCQIVFQNGGRRSR